MPKFEQTLVQKQTFVGSNLNNERSKSEQPIPINYQLTNQLTTYKRDIVEQSTTTPIPYSEIVDYLNMKVGSNYKSTSKKTQSLIKARFNEKFTIDDFKKVIDIKSSQWLKDNKMKSYLRPETLFGTKFESYLNEAISIKPKQDYSFSESIGLKVW